MKNHHQLPLKEILRNLGTSKDGLSEDKAQKRLALEGPNLLQAPKKENPILKFLKQFTNTLIIILLVTAVVCFFIPGHWTDGIVILLVVMLNGIMGYIQEFRAEKAIFALKRLSAAEANVVRGGKVKKISAADLVKGDIVTFKPGGKIPADCRLVESDSVEIDESILTGESHPITKVEVDQPKDVPLAERKNMAYMGTMVTAGEGKGVVVEVGMGTEIGQITKMVMDEEESDTPLTKQLDKLAKALAVFAMVVGGILFLMVWYKNGHPTALEWDTLNTLVPAFLMGISVMVAVIPEGLPVVVALTLTIGMQMMAKKNAIVRRLAGVETLGCTSYICTDKTGTLTKNQMTVKKVYYDGRTYDVTGEGYNPEGKIRSDDKDLDLSKNPDLAFMFEIGVLCNDVQPLKKKGFETIGSPTDRALYYAGLKAGLDHKQLNERYAQLAKIPFNSERKLMITFHAIPDDERILVLIKGAPEIIMDLCKSVIIDGKEVPLDEAQGAKINKVNVDLGLKTYRNLGVAYSKVKPEELAIPSKEDQKNIREFLRRAIQFTFVGMYSLWDPPRTEVKGAIKLCKTAGIKVVMVTGDQTATALAVGQKIGIYKAGDKVITGSELNDMEDEEFEKIVDKVTIYSRTTPKHKMRIVEALKKRGEVVAMTGDGVNDAPALAKADIGVAMGLTGSDVARDASTVILTDDNFATIVGAVEEGRKIYSNIKRFVRYQISTNVGAILLIIFSILLNFPLPLLPVQILWINILIDGPPAIALGMERVTQDVMKQPPRPTNERILRPETVISILLLGGVMAVGTTFLFWYGMHAHPGTGNKAAITMAFTTFVIFQLLNVLNCKSDTETVFSKSLFSNKFILGAIGACLVAQLVLIYTPLGWNFFHTVALTGFDWVIIISIALSIIVVEETAKYFRRNPLF